MPAGGSGFDVAVPPGGYRWWYVDALSDCGQYALVAIAFIGSVFSPYYHWSGRGRPENHVAFNIALHGPDGRAWAMTERGQASLTRSANRLQIGASSLTLTADGGLELAFREIALPWPGQGLLPRRIEGQVRIAATARTVWPFQLDETGQHFWMPLVPAASVEVEGNVFAQRRWIGHAYHDSNWGNRPLQQDFLGWDWARGRTERGEVALLYDARLTGGGRRSLALHLGPDGLLHAMPMAARQTLPRGFWGVKAGIACDAGDAPEILTRLEDGPFYRRNLVRTRLDGRDWRMMQESLDCTRLDNPLVRLMLPFRMPRRA